jgi:uncharacterized protein
MNRPLLAVLVLFAMVLPSLIAWLGFVVLLGAGGGASPAMQVVYSLGKVVQFSLPIVVLLFVERRRPVWPRSLWSGFWPGLAFGLVVVAGMFALYFGWLRGSEVFADSPERIRRKLIDLGLATPTRFLMLAVALSAVHSLLEEYYYRWFIFGRLRELVPWSVALIVSCLAFMAHHVILLSAYLPGRFWIAVVPFSLCIAMGGWVWAWLYDRSGSLVGPWVSHLLIDVAIFVIGWDLIHTM